ncbi:MAG: hypothetical protein HY821_06185 [Acidobacteria bacterium]|nr:hypothetical protein [Acidobacteriota bacterium]
MKISGICCITYLASSLLLAASPAAVQAPSSRAVAIRESLAAIEAECQRAAGGDWQKWNDALSPFREEMLRRIKALRPYNPAATGSFESRSAVLESLSDPPLFEADPQNYLVHILDGANLREWLPSRTAILAMNSISNWLRLKGIEFLVVPVPKLTEVYPDLMATGTPADRIVSPPTRLLVNELLRQDVETIDLLPMYLAARRKSPSLLYSPVDTHWRQEAQIMATLEIGRRLRRNQFFNAAKAKPPIFDERSQSMYWRGTFYEALNPRQRERVESFLTMPLVEVSPKPGYALTKVDAPVVMIGDSFAGGLLPLLARELNVPINDLSSAGQTTQAVKDFLRDPSLLAPAKAVVLFVSMRTLAVAEWQTPPPILKLAKPIR